MMKDLELNEQEVGALYSFKLEEIAGMGPIFSDDEDYIPNPELQ